MGRAFEKRKHKIFAINAKNARAFTRIVKDIAIAVTFGGSSPEGSSLLRMMMTNSISFYIYKVHVSGGNKVYALKC